MTGSRLATIALVLALLVGAVAPGTIAAAAPPDGLLDGQPHFLRLRHQMAELPAAPRSIPRAEATAAAQAVTSCDAAAVTALPRVPTTKPAADTPAACVVLPELDAKTRLLLSGAHLAGDGIRSVEKRGAGGGRFAVVLHTTERGANLLTLAGPAVAELPQYLDLDGEVVGRATVQSTEDAASTDVVIVPLEGDGFTRDVADDLVARLRQARDEQLVTLADGATLTRRARQLLLDRAARIDDKEGFNRDCPNPETANTLVLGCYAGNRIYVLRVDQANLAGVMNVSLAHEVLHAAYDDLTPAERRRITRQLETFMEESGDPRIEDLLVEYERFEPGARATELHSLVGTQVADLPRALERHYARYFKDRAAVVNAFVGYQSVFDALQQQYEQLKAQADSLTPQISEIERAYEAASTDADRLFEEIESLRRQGRIDESNALVDAQNAAADRANALLDQYNGLVAQYNAVVAEINSIAAALNENYNAISPTEIPLATE